jgi:hypothetical protein
MQSAGHRAYRHAGFAHVHAGRRRADAQRTDTGRLAQRSFDASVQYLLIYSLWFLDRVEEADRVASRAMEM